MKFKLRALAVLCSLYPQFSGTVKCELLQELLLSKAVSRRRKESKEERQNKRREGRILHTFPDSRTSCNIQIRDEFEFGYSSNIREF